jgi:hypothetical protein
MAVFLIVVGFLATLAAVARDLFGGWNNWLSGFAVVLAGFAMGASIFLELNAQADEATNRAQIEQLLSDAREAASDREVERNLQEEDRQAQSAINEAEERARKLQQCEEALKPIWAFHSAVESIRYGRPLVIENFTWHELKTRRYNELQARNMKLDVSLALVLERSTVPLLSPVLFQHYQSVQPTGVESVINRINATVGTIVDMGCTLEWGNSSTGVVARIE